MLSQQYKSMENIEGVNLPVTLGEKLIPTANNLFSGKINSLSRLTVC